MSDVDYCDLEGWLDPEEWTASDTGSPEEYESHDPCRDCGPSCPDWLGDGLCQLSLDAQIRAHKQFFKIFKPIQSKCGKCGKSLRLYFVPEDRLWLWPGELDPMIGLEIYGPYSAEHGVLCQSAQVYHVWIGHPDNEVLISMVGRDQIPCAAMD